MAVTINNILDQFETLGGSTLLNDIKAYWKLDETEGATAYDELDTYDGTIVGTPVQGSTGISGTAYLFEEEAIDCGASVGDMGTSNFSISCWINVPTLIGTLDGIVGNFTYFPFYYLALFPSTKIGMRFNIPDGTDYDLYSNDVILEDTWYHIVILVDRSGYVLMYLNNVKQTQELDISALSATPINNTYVFNIGGIGNNNSTYMFNGTIDEVGLWTRLLTVDEISELYNGGSGNTYPF